MTSGVLRQISDEPNFEKQMGCMAGFFQIFDRNQQRIYGPKRIPTLPASGSSSPSQRSHFDEKSDLFPSSPENNTKIPIPVPVFDFTEGNKNSWKLREAPRLSLDSRLRPREIRTAPANFHANNSDQDSDKNRRSPSVVARLMGLENLPELAGAANKAAELRRSASESHVSRDLNRFFDSEPLEFKMEPKQTVVAAKKSEAQINGFLRRNNFNAQELYPETTNRVGSQKSLYEEFEKRLKMRGIEEPSRNLEALKQILEALQLKGLLHSRGGGGGNAVSDRPIVVMKPGPKPVRRGSNAVEEKRVRSRSPGSHDLNLRRNVRGSNIHSSSPKLSPRQMMVDNMVTTRSPRNRRLVKERMSFMVEDDSVSAVSEGSISSASIFDIERSRMENRAGKNLLERCDKLLNNITAFTSVDKVSASDQQPSPVSVLDSSFLAEESSPSPVKKRSINFTDPFEEWEDNCWVGSKPDYVTESEFTDYSYMLNVVLAFDRYSNVSASDVYLFLEQRFSGMDSSSRSILNRRVLFDAVNEILDRKHHISPWDSVSQRRLAFDGTQLITEVWTEVKKVKEVVEAEDLNEFTCEVIRKDMARGEHVWGDTWTEMSDVVLHIERLVFRDLVGELIRDFADVVTGKKNRNQLPRRKLLF